MAAKGGSPQQQTPSKKPMSPLKRFHRVAPSPEPPSTSMATKPFPRLPGGRALQSSSASTLDGGGTPVGNTWSGQEGERPGSAPVRRDEGQATPYEQPMVAVTTVKSKGGQEPGIRRMHDYTAPTFGSCLAMIPPHWVVFAKDFFCGQC